MQKDYRELQRCQVVSPRRPLRRAAYYFKSLPEAYLARTRIFGGSFSRMVVAFFFCKCMLSFTPRLSQAYARIHFRSLEGYTAEAAPELFHIISSIGPLRPTLRILLAILQQQL